MGFLFRYCPYPRYPESTVTSNVMSATMRVTNSEQHAWIDSFPGKVIVRIKGITFPLSPKAIAGRHLGRKLVDLVVRQLILAKRAAGWVSRRRRTGDQIRRQ